MWMLGVEHGLELSAGFALAALLDEEPGQNQMGIGIAAIRPDSTPQMQFCLFLISPQQPGQLGV